MRAIKFIIVNVLNVYFKRREMLSLSTQKEEIVEGKQNLRCSKIILHLKRHSNVNIKTDLT